ncbi:beta-galactosidase [Candidatus Daviesbacteria bacterium]|nr:beta-galactosidase [Candidatus Daviesbacteria bacterium]
MSFLPIAILAYALNGGAVVIDKILLNTSLPKPAIYTFYISLLGLFTLLLLPFGFQWQFAVLPAALFSGVAGTLALLTFFQSLKMGQASVAGPLVGALNPLFALILGTLFFNQLISPSQFIAMLVLILGAGVLTFNVWFSKIDTFRQFLIMALAGFLFALSYVFLKEVFLQSNFVTGLVLTRLFGAGAALTFLFWPGFGKQIFASRIKKHTSLLLLAGQSMGAAQGFLLAAATALASPALVNSLFGVQYLVILWVALVLGKNHPRLLDENLSKKVVLQKIAGVAILSFGVYLLSVSSGAVLEKKVSLGVSFSPRYAQELGLDARATYQSILQELSTKSVRLSQSILQELSTKSVRLSAYWNEIEPEQDQFNFDELDWYVSEASKNQSRVLLAIGYKLPRWPECRAPEWFSRDRQLIMLEKVIEHYENNPAVFAWQLENEPLLPYGLCPPPGSWKMNRFCPMACAPRRIGNS